MTRLPDWRAALLLTRPAQWPILTAQWGLGVLLAGPAWGPGWTDWAGDLNSAAVAAAWFSWVVLLNGGTLAFNSAYDRDTGPIAYLAAPPRPPAWLAGASLAAMGLGVALAWLAVGHLLAIVTAVCLGLSVLYSHPRTRLKARPGADLLVNVAGYGAATTLAGLITGTRGPPEPSGWWLAAGFGLLFGSLYPLTQIYQTAADRRRGDTTLTTALGNQRALVLALALGSAAAVVLLSGCRLAGRTGMWILPAAALTLWIGHVAWWLCQGGDWDDRRHEAGMYRALAIWALVDASLAGAWLAG